MKAIDVEIVGDSSLMMHNPKSMLDAKPATRSSADKPTYKEEASKSAYSNEKGELYIPSQAIFSSILNGGSFKKVGKYPARTVLAGNIRIEPENIPLLDMKGKTYTKYEVDLRTVVIASGRKRNRIVRARPIIRDWKARFRIVYNDEIIGNSEIIKDCLKDAGYRVGLLEFRPQTNGSYGTFSIEQFKEGGTVERKRKR